MMNFVISKTQRLKKERKLIKIVTAFLIYVLLYRSTNFNSSNTGGNSLKLDSGSSNDGSSRPSPRPASAGRSLSFDICNGFTNQRLSLFYGIIVAIETGRDMYLPNAVLDGLQITGENILAVKGNSKPLTEFYDKLELEGFFSNLPIGVRISDESPKTLSPEFLLSASYDEWIQSSYSHIHIGCPLLLVPTTIVEKYEGLLRALFNSLKPAFSLKKSISRALIKLETFNFLHLRIENDWIHHCEVWQGELEFGNCFTNTFSVADHLLSKDIEIDVPLYVACEWHNANKTIADFVIKKIIGAGYDVKTKADVFESTPWHREEAALIDYYIGLQSNKFVGNSVSTFSALNILERQFNGAWSSSYNLGLEPLSLFLPFYQMPWVFTYNGKSANYDYMVKSAVRSGLKLGNLKAFCIYDGTPKDEIYRWMVSNGVKVINHTPIWKGLIWKKFNESLKVGDTATTFSSAESLFGTYQRIDIPTIQELDQYNYVLFTDADVMFTKQIQLKSFGSKLPGAIAMAYEMTDIFPCNAGVMLINLPAIRGMHDKLVEFAFNRTTLYHEGYGPADQGALNEFFKKEMNQSCTLSESFNTKPHKANNISTIPHIIHFHGPKPHHYLEYLEKGTCGPFTSIATSRAGNLCNGGIKFICDNVAQFIPYARQDDTFFKLQKACLRQGLL
jgi:hypothetical protein